MWYNSIRKTEKQYLTESIFMSRAGTMTRTPAGEALRRVHQANTWYARLVEKNRHAEAGYREKIARLEATHAELQEAENQ